MDDVALSVADILRRVRQNDEAAARELVEYLYPLVMKIVFGLLLIFLAGAVTGSVFTTIAIKRVFARSLKFENWTASTAAYLEKKLNLTSDQKPKLRVIVEDMGKQLQSEFSKTLNESGRILVQSGRRIDQELTPQQRAIHAEMKKQFRAELKKSMNIDLPEE